MTCYYSLSNIKEYRKLTIERREEIADQIKSINRKLEIERNILATHHELHARERKSAERYICKLEKELTKWVRLLDPGIRN